MKFQITDKQYIQVIPEPIPEGYCEVCARSDVDYVDEELGLTIKFGQTEADMFYGGFGTTDYVEDLINNKKYFDQDVTPDLGFEWNQFFQGLIKDTDVLENYHFVGNDHTEKRPYFNSWFYNDKDGNIIFEITPFYPWHYATKKQCPDKIPYKEWIKNYQVIVRKVIPKETLIAWDKQAKLYNHWKHA
ncbi:hypothetical protein KBD08_00590 [Candidatus Babeliales bacterium]|nr:hypothetical protein [Candidatus Babeliales bacterium]